MGVKNKQRRAAKAKARAKRRTAPDHDSCESTDGAHADRLRVGAASLALRDLVRHTADGRIAAPLRARFIGFEERYQRLAVDDQLAAAVPGVIAGGWTPLDLAEVGRRDLDGAVVEHLLGRVADETARFPRGPGASGLVGAVGRRPGRDGQPGVGPA